MQVQDAPRLILVCGRRRWDDAGADALGQPAYLLVAQARLTSNGLACVLPGSKQLLGPLQSDAPKALNPDVLLRQRASVAARLSQRQASARMLSSQSTPQSSWSQLIPGPRGRAGGVPAWPAHRPRWRRTYPTWIGYASRPDA